MRLEAGVFSHEEAFKLRHDLQQRKCIFHLNWSPLSLAIHFSFIVLCMILYSVFSLLNFSPSPLFPSMCPSIFLSSYSCHTVYDVQQNELATFSV